MESGKRKAQTPSLYFESLEDLRRALTPKRMDLLVAILRQAPGSVTELAKLAGRDLKNVSEDLTLLRQLRLVPIRITRGARFCHSEYPIALRAKRVGEEQKSSVRYAHGKYSRLHCYYKSLRVFGGVCEKFCS